MSTPSGYNGPGNDPYATPSQPDPAGAGNAYQPTGGPPAGQYPSQPYGAPGYPPAGAYGAAPSARPGMVTAAAVLAFVVGGLSILIGLLALFAGSALTGYVGGLGGVVNRDLHPGAGRRCALHLVRLMALQARTPRSLPSSRSSPPCCS